MVAFHPEGSPGDIRLEGKAMSLGLDIGHCVETTRYKDARRWTFYGCSEIFLFSTKAMRIHCQKRSHSGRMLCIWAGSLSFLCQAAVGNKK